MTISYNMHQHLPQSSFRAPEECLDWPTLSLKNIKVTYTQLSLTASPKQVLCGILFDKKLRGFPLHDSYKEMSKVV